MKASLHIKLTEPCSEDWDKMAPTERGRFCSACQRNLVDFTAMNDEELMQFFLHHRDKVCGRFSETQLDRTIEQRENSLHFLPGRYTKRIAAMTIFMQTLVHNAYAQVNKHKTEVVARNHKANSKVSRALKGIVQDYHNKKPVSNVVVYILGTDIRCKADIHGRFRLPLTDSMHGPITIVAEYVPDTVAVHGTIILPVYVNLDSLKEEIYVYRYPDEQLEKVRIVRQRPSVSQESKYYTGIPNEITVIKKPTLMQRVRNFFRRKKHY